MLPRDLPPKNHPLLQNDDEVNTLADLINVRENRSQDTEELPGALNDDDLDVSAALTFPHKSDRNQTYPGRVGEALGDEETDFDADARTTAPAVGDAETEYLTRRDFEEEMLDADPDPNAGADENDYIAGDVNLGRAPDQSGTVTGAVRGLGTHLPQDLGAGGFQIIEPEELAGELPDARLSDATDHTFANARLQDPAGLAGDESGSSNEAPRIEPEPSLADLRGAAPSPAAPDDGGTENMADVMNQDERLLGDDLATDGGQIPTAPSHPATRDEALDATRQLQ